MEEAQSRKSRKIITRLKNKFRLVVMNDETYEEKISLVLSPMNVFIVIGSIVLFLIISTIYLIAFTGLREYIPGYSSDISIRRKMINVSLKTDSLIDEMRMKDEYIANINAIINGNIKSEVTGSRADTTQKYVNINLSASEEDSLLRADIEQLDKYSLAVNTSQKEKNDISSFFFFTPLSGLVINKYRATPDHYGIDIVAKKNAAVKATLDGTVISSNYTIETGHVIQIQHANDLVSVYKHNSALLKKTGERVKAGEAIAIVGNSGEITSGPHLHFELWYRGTPINPQEYISF
jgi:murein DD-endopeptidase MepM/ murein hydrolase activator NlpD